MLLEFLRSGSGRFCLAIIAAIVLLTTVVTLPVMLLRPHDSIVPLVVNGTTLFKLDFDNTTSTVAYNFTVMLSFHNPNILSMSFDNVAMTPLYAGGEKIGPEAKLPAFRLRRKQTVVVPMGMQGGETLGGKVAAAVTRTYAEEAGRGYFTIETAVHVPGVRHWYDFVCTLHFPAPPTATALGAANLFDGDACTVVKNCYHHRYGYICTGG